MVWNKAEEPSNKFQHFRPFLGFWLSGLASRTGGGMADATVDASAAEVKAAVGKDHNQWVVQGRALAALGWRLASYCVVGSCVFF